MFPIPKWIVMPSILNVALPIYIIKIFFASKDQSKVVCYNVLTNLVWERMW